MKRIIIMMSIFLSCVTLHSQKLYKNVYFGENKAEAKPILSADSFRIQFGDYVTDEITGYYKRGILIGVSLDQTLKTSMKNAFTGDKGKETTLNTIFTIRDSFIKNGYVVNYENTVLNLASHSPLKSARGFNYILQKDSILVGIGYVCSVGQQHNLTNPGDQFMLLIFKTSIMLSDADYNSMFFMDRIKKTQSNIF